MSKRCTPNIVNAFPKAHCMFPFDRDHTSSLSCSQVSWPTEVSIFPSQITGIYTVDNFYICDFSVIYYLFTLNTELIILKSAQIAHYS